MTEKHAEKEASVRKQQVDERRQHHAKRIARVENVRVVAANEDIARVLKHPKGQKLRADGGSVEWPLDQFTRRRIAEGAVTIEEEKQEEKPREERHGSRRHHTTAAEPAEPPA